MSVIEEEAVRGGKGVFREICSEDEELQPTEIESLCMNCYQNVSHSVVSRMNTILDLISR